MHSTDASQITDKSNRILYYDYLRILAIFTTVAIHVIAQDRYTLDIHSYQWRVYNVFLSAFRWGVPVFIMISGALFLNPDKKIVIATLYKKNLTRLLLGFCFWALAYAVVFDIRGKTLSKFFYSMFTGDFHMWFLFMIAVMYMLTPLLRKFTCDMGLTRYFLTVSFLISFAIPQLLFLLNLTQIPYLDSILQGMQKSFGDMRGYFPHYYLFYFIAGHYLSTTELPTRIRKYIYLLSLAAYFFTVVATKLYSGYIGANSDAFHSHDGVNIAMMSIAMFIFGKYELSRIRLPKRWVDFLLKLSSYSLGIYYIHLMIIKAVYGLMDLSERGIHPLITCMVFPPIAFVISAAATAIMRKIPLLNKVV